MESMLRLVGLGLVIGMVVAIGFYAWHGEWGAVVLAVGAAFIGQFLLGFIEFCLIPFTFLTIFFAKRGNKWISIVLYAILALVTRSLYVAFCGLMLLAFLRTPGPPVWLIVILASGAASAPFGQAAQRLADKNDPRSVDQVHALIGTAAGGILFLLGFGTAYSLTPLSLLFLVSAISSVSWWSSCKLPGIQLEGLIEQNVMSNPIRQNPIDDEDDEDDEDDDAGSDLQTTSDRSVDGDGSTGRNARCPCGSGIRFKHCCGKPA